MDVFWTRLQFRLAGLFGKSRRRCVFIHIPKCAGSSLDFHFKANCGSQRSGRVVLLDTWDEPISEATLARARSALYVSGHFGWSTLEKVDNNALRFAALREPFTRLLSLYLHCRRPDASNARRHPGFAALMESAKRLPFEEFCLNREPAARAMVENAQARTLAGDFHPHSAKPAERVRAAARRNLDTLDLVWDAAELDKAFPIIAARTGTRLIPGKTALNRAKPSDSVRMTRSDFLKDSSLARIVALDMDIYEDARARGTPASAAYATLAPLAFATLSQVVQPIA